MRERKAANARLSILCLGRDGWTTVDRVSAECLDQSECLARNGRAADELSEEVSSVYATRGLGNRIARAAFPALIISFAASAEDSCPAARGRLAARQREAGCGDRHRARD